MAQRVVRCSCVAKVKLRQTSHMSNSAAANSRRAVASVCVAYIWWGLSAIFWRALDTVAPIDQLGYRVGFGALFLLIWATVKRTRPFTGLTPRHLKFGVFSAAMIATNWSVFLWAIDNDQAVEAALGYFLMPLISVAIGVLALGERLTTDQKVALGLGSVGLVWTFVVIGTIPWVALALGVTFALYGWGRKVGPWNTVDGLTFETSLVTPVVVGIVAWRGVGGEEIMGDGSLTTLLLIVAAGLITIIPLLLFASAARQVSLTVIGLLQYINPSLQFLVGWQLFGEAVPMGRFLGFLWIWVALGFVIRSEVRAARQRSATGDPRGRNHPNSESQESHRVSTTPRSEAAPSQPDRS